MTRAVQNKIGSRLPPLKDNAFQGGGTGSVKKVWCLSSIALSNSGELQMELDILEGERRRRKGLIEPGAQIAISE